MSARLGEIPSAWKMNLCSCLVTQDKILRMKNTTKEYKIKYDNSSLHLYHPYPIKVNVEETEGFFIRNDPTGCIIYSNVCIKAVCTAPHAACRMSEEMQSDCDAETLYKGSALPEMNESLSRGSVLTGGAEGQSISIFLHPDRSDQAKNDVAATAGPRPYSHHNLTLSFRPSICTCAFSLHFSPLADSSVQRVLQWEMESSHWASMSIKCCLTGAKLPPTVTVQNYGERMKREETLEEVRSDRRSSEKSCALWRTWPMNEEGGVGVHLVFSRTGSISSSASPKYLAKIAVNLDNPEFVILSLLHMVFYM